MSDVNAQIAEAFYRIMSDNANSELGLEIVSMPGVVISDEVVNRDSCIGPFGEQPHESGKALWDAVPILNEVLEDVADEKENLNFRSSQP